MSKVVLDKINYFLKKYRLIGNDDRLYEDTGVEEDFLYPEFYALKHLYDHHNFDLDKLKNSKTNYEYRNNLIDELHEHSCLGFDSDIYGILDEGREEIFDYIKTIDPSSFDISLPGDYWHYDDYLNTIIDFSKIHSVLSIYDVYYNPNLKQYTKVDVIGHEFAYSEMKSEMIRIHLDRNCKLYDYKIIENEHIFPLTIDKKYDFVFMNLGFTEKDSIDKTSYIEFDEEILDAKYDGDDSNAIMINLMNYLNENGKAVLYTPLSLVSKIDMHLLNENYIENIIFLPSKKILLNGKIQDTVYVYIILSKNKVDDSVKMINLINGDRVRVTNDLIKQFHGNININLYTRHNPKTIKLYHLKEKNYQQLEIIKESSLLIDKMIDEFDFKD